MNDSAEVAALLEKARGGDSETVSRLLAVYRSYLKLLARVQVDRVIRAKIDPSDLVQEVCIQVHRDLPQFRGTTEAEFLAWLRTVLAAKGANLVRQFRGTKRRDVRLEQQLVEAAERSSVLLGQPLLATDPAPSSHAIRSERTVAIADALAQLDPHYREVVILHNLEELPMSIVAEKMGRSVDSVRKLWARAVVQLRQLLKSES
jgi:RNA polymerase sigma-70 factor (ECF subfamily)